MSSAIRESNFTRRVAKVGFKRLKFRILTSLVSLFVISVEVEDRNEGRSERKDQMRSDNFKIVKRE